MTTKSCKVTTRKKLLGSGNDARIAAPKARFEASFRGRDIRAAAPISVRSRSTSVVTHRIFRRIHGRPRSLPLDYGRENEKRNQKADFRSDTHSILDRVLLVGACARGGSAELYSVVIRRTSARF